MFNNISIRDKTKEELQTAVNSGRLSHAVILEGADEETRLRAAKELAKAIVCTNSNKPCGICPSCIKAAADSHPDIHFLEKAKENANIKVDEIRDLKKAAALLPNDGNKSVFIIYEGQNMLIPSQNALLKIFEEPANHVNFIITCNAKSCFLDTIISRGSAYNLGNENTNSSTDEKENSFKEKAAELLNIFSDKNEYEFLCAVSVFQKDKELFEGTLNHMCIILRDALIYSKNSNITVSGYQETAKKLSMRLTSKKLIDCIESIRIISDNFNSSSNYNLTVTRLTSILYGIKTG